MVSTYPTQMTRWQLQPHELRHIGNSKGITTILCETGILWITLKGDHRDYILNPGERFLLGKHEKALVEALTSAHVRVESPRNIRPGFSPGIPRHKAA